MVLSETRGLRLSWVIRGGIGLTRRLSARGTAYRPLGCSPSNPSVSRLKGPQPEGKIIGDGPGGYFETLKRLAILVFLDRSFLLFSKWLR